MKQATRIQIYYKANKANKASKFIINTGKEKWLENCRCYVAFLACNYFAGLLCCALAMYLKNSTSSQCRVF